MFGVANSRIATAISCGGAHSLHADWIDQNLQPRRAPFQNVENIANGRAARRSDDPDASRKFRQSAFPCGIEKSFRLQFALERFEFCLKQTESARLQDLHAQLILSSRFEDRNVSVNLHLRAVGQRRAQWRHRIAKNHASDLRPGIFECEILVAARDAACNLKFRPAPRPRRISSRAVPRICRGQLADGENLRRLLEEIGRQLHEA